MNLKIASSLVTLIFLYSGSRGSNIDDVRVARGKEKYETIVRDSKMPKYGPCWKDALAKTELGCNDLTEEMQHYLALLFSNCFLLKMGRETYPCELGQDIADCTKTLNSEAMVIYSEFFTHTQNICYFLKAQVWQEETEGTITRLSDASASVAQHLQDSSSLQEEILSKQNLSMVNQEALLKRGADLKQTLEDSSTDVHAMLSEFKDTTSQQREMIFEVFDRIKVLQSLVMGEFTGFYSIIFYAMSIVISYFLTSTPRTSGARFWLFLLMTVNMVTERMLTYIQSSPTFDGKGQLLDENTQIYIRLWWCRKIFTGLGILTWSWFAYSYKDLTKINHCLLMDIKKQNSDLKRLLQTSGVNLPQTPVNGDLSQRSILGGFEDTDGAIDMLTSNCIEPSVNRYSLETGYGSGTDVSHNSESDSSSDSGTSDHTFVAADSDSEAESFLTTDSFGSSRAGTPRLESELHFLRQATPLKEMTPVRGVTGHDFSSNPQSVTYSIQKTGPTPRRKRQPRSKNTPGSSPAEHTYNLRSRRGVNQSMDNPVVDSESPKDFSKAVKNLAKVAYNNSIKTLMTVERLKRDSNTKFFSSDED